MVCWRGLKRLGRPGMPPGLTCLQGCIRQRTMARFPVSFKRTMARFPVSYNIFKEAPGVMRSESSSFHSERRFAKRPIHT